MLGQALYNWKGVVIPQMLYEITKWGDQNPQNHYSWNPPLRYQYIVKVF